MAMKFMPLITSFFLHCSVNYITGNVVRALYSSCSLANVAVMGLDKAHMTILRVVIVICEILSVMARIAFHKRFI